MEQEALAAIEKAKAKEVVPDEGGEGDHEGVVGEGNDGAAGFAFGDEEFRTEGAVAVHVLEVALEGGVSVVDEVGVECLQIAGEGDGLVDGPVGKAGRWGEVCGVTAEEAELGVGIEAAIADPAVEEEIAALEEVGVCGGVAGEECPDLSLEFGAEFFVGVEREDPGPGALFDGRVFLRREALPGLGDDGGIEGAGDLEGAVGGARVEDDNLVGELDAQEGAGKVGLFVERDDGDGEQWCVRQRYSLEVMGSLPASRRFSIGCMLLRTL